jgi:hypothetical protein
VREEHLTPAPSAVRRVQLIILAVLFATLAAARPKWHELDLQNGTNRKQLSPASTMRRVQLIILAVLLTTLSAGRQGQYDSCWANRSATPFSGSQVRIVLRTATAAALSKGSTYDTVVPRRACVAAVHLPAGSSALLSDVLVAATDGSSLHVLGDSGIAALGLVAQAFPRGTSGALTALEVDGFVAVAIGSSVDVRATVDGAGSSAMGIVTAFRGAACMARRVVMFAARSNVIVQVGEYGYGTVALALVIYASSFLSADNTLLYAIESTVTVTFGRGGSGVGVLGVANYGASTAIAAACSNFSVYSESSAVTVNLGVNGGAMNGLGLAVMGFAVSAGQLAGANLSIRAVNTTAAVRASGRGWGTAIAGFAAFNSAAFGPTNIVIYVSQSILKLTCAQGSGVAVLGAVADEYSHTAVAFVVVSCVDSNVSFNSEGPGDGASMLGFATHYNSWAPVNDLRIYVATSTLVMSTKSPFTDFWTSALGFSVDFGIVGTRVLIQQCAVTYDVGAAVFGDLSKCTNCTNVTTLAPCVPLTAPVDEAIAPLLAQTASAALMEHCVRARSLDATRTFSDTVVSRSISASGTPTARSQRTGTLTWTPRQGDSVLRDRRTESLSFSASGTSSPRALSTSTSTSTTAALTTGENQPPRLTTSVSPDLQRQPDVTDYAKKRR